MTASVLTIPLTVLICRFSCSLIWERERLGYSSLKQLRMLIASGALIDLGGDAVNGIKLTAYFSENSDSAKSQEFVTAYQEEYGDVPGTYVAYAYDAALIVMDAIENAGEDRAAIRDYMSTVEGFEGATGTATFDENGDVIKAPLRMEIQDGKYTIVEK